MSLLGPTATTRRSHRLPALRADHSPAGEELLLRHRAAARRQAARAVGRVRVRPADRRHRRRHACRPRTRSLRLEASARTGLAHRGAATGRLELADDLGAGRAARRRHQVSDPGRGVRRADRRLRGRRARGHATPRSMTCGTTAGASPARSAGSRSASSAAPNLARADAARRLARRRLQLTNIIRDIKEDLGNGRVYLPAEDLRAVRLHAGAGRRPDGQESCWPATWRA